MAAQTAARERAWSAGWLRAALLALMLAAFARVAYDLEGKNFWWDESLSLQRAESPLRLLLPGILVIKDGFTEQPTIDQHPFLLFLLQKGLIALAGNDESVLRFIPAMAATLLVPALYTLGRALARRGVLPGAAAGWVALLAAFSPFLLWYGQEARPYTLWALLAVVSTYLLLIGTEAEHRLRWRRWGYAVTLALYLATHFFAVFLLPVHSAMIYGALARRNRRRALLGALALLIGGALLGAFAAYRLLVQGGAGANFQPISLGILLPDLLNAFSLGLSVRITDVWWLDLLFGALLLAGIGWSLRSRAALRAGGWIVPACLLTPIVALMVVNSVQPVYMNARHLSLLIGPFLLLVGAGLAVSALLWRWAAPLLAVLLLAGYAYSTANYFTLEEYAKDDFAGLGAYMDGRIMPGDAVIYYPPASWRIFDYYVPIEAARAAQAAGAPVTVLGLPLLAGGWDATFAALEELAQTHSRIWVLKSGTHPYADLEGRLEEWLRENMTTIRDVTFFSHSSLRSQLYLPTSPAIDGAPPPVEQSAGARFGDLVRLVGSDVGADAPGLPTPLTLYWQINETTDRRYKYLLQLVERNADGSARVLATVEREPYDGDVPTIYWQPGQTIREYVELPTQAMEQPGGGELALALQVYDAETLEKLPLTDAGAGEAAPDGTTVFFPFTPLDTDAP
jgi:4-amino-4-deoxy-L-arabinose transferase-like glycosyltransferase